MKLSSLASTLMSFTLFSATVVHAGDSFFDLSIGNSGVYGYAGPYVKVDVHLLTETSATVTFVSLTKNGNIALMGDGGTVGVNGLFTISNVVASNHGMGFVTNSLPFGGGCTSGELGCILDSGRGNEDGFGAFSDTLKSHGGYTDAWDTVSLTLTANTGTVWATADNVLVPNASGYLAAAHIFITSDPANAAISSYATGYATGASPVPEPNVLALLIGGFGVIGLFAHATSSQLGRSS